MKTNNKRLIGAAVVFKDQRGKRTFLIVRYGEEDEWEFPKITVRKGESSARSVIRMTGENAGISAKILEEAGRISKEARIDGRLVPEKTYYYLMILMAGREVMGFSDYKWLEYAKAKQKLTWKREKDILVQTRDVLKQWEKAQKLNKK